MATVDNSRRGLRVSSLNSTFSSPLPNLTPLNTDRKSSLPKGCRFRDLGEAHRNITGRSISASHGANGLTESVSGSTGDTHPDSPFRDPILQDGDHGIQQDILDSPLSPSSMDLLNSLGSPEDLIDKIFDRKGTRSCSPALVSTPAPKKEKCSPLVRHVSDENVSPLRHVRTSQGPDRSSDSHMAMTVYSTDTTVGRLYTQYQTHILNPLYANNSSPVPVIPHVVRPLPSINIQRPHDGHAKMLEDSPTNSQKRGSLFMSVPTRESLLYPEPLRVVSMRAEGKHTSIHGGTAVSTAGMTTDSEEDPFRYDKDAYNIFLHPSKERDVSTALNHISGLSSHSRATLCTQEDELPARKLSLRPPPIPKEYLEEDPYLTGPTRACSPTPDSVDGFYDTSVIQPNWAVQRSAYEVKVVLQDVSHNQSVNGGHRSKTGGGSTTASEKPPAPSIQNSFQTGGLYRRADKENFPSSERDDWETVATTAPGYGSMRLHPPAAGREPFNLLNSRGAKVTGSSVADVSDDNSLHNVPFEEYASTDRIVQHPSRHEDSEESLQIHDVSGRKVPVMIPKQREHRVNGYPQNSSRLYPHSQRSGGEAAAALARKVSSPFRQFSGRQPHRFSPMPLQPPPFKLEKGRKRFEFRHHSQNSDRDPLFGKGGVYEFQGVSSDTGNTRSDTNNITTSGLDDGLADHHSLRDSSSSHSSNGTAHSFPFPLIPLPEAARLHAAGRMTGTESSAADTFWARNAANKKRPRGIRAPERAYQRPPTRFASMFTSSSARSSHQSRLKKRRTLTQDFTMQSALSSTTGGGTGTWATILPIGSTSNRYGGPTQMLKSAATRLHLDDLARRFQERKKPSLTMGSSLISRSSQPRLYPWDYQARRRQQRARGTDPELRAIALSEPGAGRDLERTGVPLDPEAFITQEGRMRRQTWFYCMLAVSMFPFISVLVYLGKFDNGLSWYTRGEVDRLNSQQRRIILVVMVGQFVFWPIVLGLVIWRAQQLA